uniref:Uncharacterized protein n=1 Tax=Lactuca sativa TaxID=4236 RepID=A0A9R1W4S7_LACSA|nr:hypothetical protein LSAT_V11C300115940 [Lactuca sativa]
MITHLIKFISLKKKKQIYDDNWYNAGKGAHLTLKRGENGKIYDKRTIQKKSRDSTKETTVYIDKIIKIREVTFVHGVDIQTLPPGL